MKKFDTIVNKVFVNLLSEAPLPIPGLDQTGGPQMPPAGAAPAPAAGPAAAPAQPEQPAPAEEPKEPKPLTSPGRAYLVDLMRRALEIDPKSLEEADMAVFAEDDVTVENAAEVEKKIAEIVNRVNPSRVSD